MTDRSDLETALERLVEAAKAHLAAVRAAGGRAEDDDVWRAYVDLNNASYAYDELLLDEYGEVTPWDVEPIDPSDAEWLQAAEPAVADERPATISVRQRRDYTVPSTAALLRAARAARHASGHPNPDEPVTSIGQAVAELMHAGDGALGALDVPELEPLGGVVAVTEVPRPLGPSESGESPDGGPFRIAADEPLLYRFEEHVEDDPDR